jgi:hypothetical protein
MPWVPIVHLDNRTVGVARYEGPVGAAPPDEVVWVGVIDHDVTPERWQGLLALLVDDHRGTGDGWMVRCAQEGVKGLDGTLFDTPRSGDSPPPGSSSSGAPDLEDLRKTDPETARIIEKLLELEHDLITRVVETQARFEDADALAARLLAILSPYDRAILATAVSDEHLELWCQQVAVNGWRSHSELRAE